MQTMIRKHIFWTALVFMAPFFYAQELSEEQRQKLEKIVTQGIEGNMPGIALGIVSQGRVVFETYAGYADLDHSVAIGPKTRFNIASNGKQFTALAILKLIEQGKVKLNEDFRTYLPEFYPNIKKPVTVAHLLNHSGGARDVYDLWALTGKTWWQMFVDNGDALDLLKRQEDLDVEPGQEFQYSNSNYILLTEIVKRVTEKSFAKYTLEMFADLGMKETGFLSNYMSVVPNRAHPYGQWSGWKKYPAIAEIHGDGGLFTTLKDQLRWEARIQTGKGDGLSQKLLSVSQQPLERAAIKNYGYGLEFGVYKGVSYQFHGGNTGAYNAYFARFPEKKLAIVAMSNHGGLSPMNIARQCADLLLGDALSETAFPTGPETPGTKSELAALVGDYELSDGTLLKVYEKDGQLFRSIHQRDPVKLIHEKGDVYAYETIDQLKMAFASDKAGHAFITLYHPTLKPNVGKKLPEATMSSEDFQSINGRYINKETGVEITLNYDKDQIYNLSLRGQNLQAHLLRKDWLQMNSYRMKVKRNNAGQVTHILASQNRLRNIAFKRIAE